MFEISEKHEKHIEKQHCVNSKTIWEEQVSWVNFIVSFATWDFWVYDFPRKST